MVPCWDAVILIILAEATGRLLLGIALLVAFGAGMAIVLVAVGVLASAVRQRVTRQSDIATYGPWERSLGVISGLALAAIGIWLISIT
jgi:ABC-type nickel/cobalt efflux system permease component RcnA